MAEIPHPLLRTELAKGNAAVAQNLVGARNRIQSSLLAATGAKTLGSAAHMRTISKGLIGHYGALGVHVDKSLRDSASRISKVFWNFAAEDVFRTSGKPVTKYSQDYANELFARVHPGNGQNLAAVRTTQMYASDIGQVRRALVETVQEGALGGWTSVERQKRLRDRIKTLSDGLDSWAFIDESGRKWKNSNYFNMLTRTTAARVARDSYHDALNQSGLDLVAVQNAGDPCPICRAWNGVIYSISGATKGFPTFADAIASGVWHPNCVCVPRYVDESIDAEAIEKQNGAPMPAVPGRDAWNRYAKRIEADARPKIAVRRPRRKALADPKKPLKLDEPEKAAFVPAKTVKEAEDYAKSTLATGKVDFAGMDLDVANQVNDGLHEMVVLNGYAKVKNLTFKPGNGSVNASAPQDSIVIRSKATVGQRNVNSIRAKKIYEDRAEEMKKRRSFLDEKLKEAKATDAQYGTETAKIWEKDIRAFDNESDLPKALAARFSTASAGGMDAWKITTIHEFGHVVHYRRGNKYKFGEGLLKGNTSGSTMSIEGKRMAAKISEYATTNPLEHFAEAWTSYHKGEKHLINPKVKGLIEKFINAEVGS